MLWLFAANKDVCKSQSVVAVRMMQAKVGQRDQLDMLTTPIAENAT